MCFLFLKVLLHSMWYLQNEAIPNRVEHTDSVCELHHCFKGVHDSEPWFFQLIGFQFLVPVCIVEPFQAELWTEPVPCMNSWEFALCQVYLNIYAIGKRRRDELARITYLMKYDAERFLSFERLLRIQNFQHDSNFQRLCNKFWAYMFLCLRSRNGVFPIQRHKLARQH